MVEELHLDNCSLLRFQYSLCRVVLMVTCIKHIGYRRAHVSVLALSSRFDGPGRSGAEIDSAAVSVLALSSRFDGPIG